MDLKDYKEFQQVTISSVIRLDDGGYKASTRIVQARTVDGEEVEEEGAYSESINKNPDIALGETLMDLQTYLAKHNGDLFKAKQEWKPDD